VPLEAKTSVSPAQGLENWRFGFNIVRGRWKVKWGDVERERLGTTWKSSLPTPSCGRGSLGEEFLVSIAEASRLPFSVFFRFLLPSVSLLLFKSEGINADLFIFASTALRRGVEIAALSF